MSSTDFSKKKCQEFFLENKFKIPMHETPKNFKELKRNPCVKQREKHV